MWLLNPSELPLYTANNDYSQLYTQTIYDTTLLKYKQIICLRVLFPVFVYFERYELI